ncbi:LamG-like jellyroll fold domain-containing protein [Gaetbulibacter sp. M240]|uniref:galactose-binding domain-containing protein n=1 Tax=Gaetbulibacter sp. M240 TaxID=3126511 RepID=UPI00374FC736
MMNIHITERIWSAIFYSSTFLNTLKQRTQGQLWLGTFVVLICLLGTTSVSAQDNDGDTISNQFDIDSDNDGIIDAIELGCEPNFVTDVSNANEAYWPFDNNTNDASGNLHNEVGSVGAVYSTNAIQGTHAIRFGSGATTSPIQYSDGTFMNSGGTTFSYSAWILPDPASFTGNVVIIEEGSSRHGLALYLDDGKLAFSTFNSDNGATVIHSGTVLNTWHHIAATFDSGILTVYLDGVPETNTASYSNIPGYGNPGGIGGVINSSAVPGNNGVFYEGLIDAFRYSSSEVWSAANIDTESTLNCAAIDSDTDGVPDYLDLDSDDDGLPDNVEAQATQLYVVPGVFSDTNSNGMNDAFEVSNLSMVPVDTDGDGMPDYLDPDSDDDGQSDLLEGLITTPTGSKGLNGLFNDAETSDDYNDVNGNAHNDTSFLLKDTDSDTNTNGSNADPVNDIDFDYRDKISDVDTDSDGILNRFDTDDDNDGISDAIELGCEPNFVTDVSSADEAYWPFENNTNDASGNGNDEVGSVTAVYSNMSMQGQYSIHFGSGATTTPVQFSDGTFMNSGGSTFSYSAWILPDPTSFTGNVVIMEEGSNKHGLALYLDDGKLAFSTYSSDIEATVIHPGTVSNTWHHIAATFDNGTLTVYLDGVSETTNTGGYTSIPSFANPGGIGGVLSSSAVPGNNGVSYAGLIDAFRYSSSEVWTAADIYTESTLNCPCVDTDTDGVTDDLDLDSDNDGIPDSIEGSLDNDGDGILNFRDIDSDNDGIPDNIEAQPTKDYMPSSGNDMDGDGLDDLYDATPNGGIAGSNGLSPENTDGIDSPDYLDLDSDNDGIFDIIESGSNLPDANTDGMTDGVVGINGLDNTAENNDNYADVNGTAYTTQFELLDTDTDITLFSTIGTTNTIDQTLANRNGNTNVDLDYRDTIADVNTDGDTHSANNHGLYDRFEDIDDDNDGILDVTEDATSNGDADGLPNRLDLDSDDDGIPDNIEAQPTSGFMPSGTDTDSDGLDDTYDATPNGGIAGSNGLTPENTDGIDSPDYTDTDSDNDGILDTDETTSDFDSDGVPNYRDIDSDSDGIVDSEEGDPNYLNTDSDGDGISDNVEAQPTIGFKAPSGNDTDGDGLDDEYDATSNGGIAGSNGLTTENTDGVDNPDFTDTDSDNDGINDSIETTIDTDSDGILNYRDLDSDNDGLLDQTEGEVNSDTDALPNYLDLDSDNDGITDNVEAQPTNSYRAPSGIGGTVNFIDSNSDGLDDNFDAGVGGGAASGVGFTPYDNDSDGTPDYIDNNTDNDTGNDIEERGDGAPTSLTSTSDTDSDGLLDIFEGTNNNDGYDVNDENIIGDDGGADANFASFNLQANSQLNPNGSNAITPFTRDLLFRQSGLDTDSDGIADITDIDDDNDGILDVTEGMVDTDGDGIINSLDLDSENDGITDNVEAQATNAYRAPSGLGSTADFIDSNSDGLDDNFDAGIIGGGAANSVGFTPYNNDSDSTPDYIDNNSDNDTEGDDIQERGDGAPTSRISTTDTDNDGLLDIFEGTNNNDGYDVNDENIIGDDGGADANFTSFNLQANSQLNPTGTSSITPFTRDLLFRQSGVDTDFDGIADITDIDDDNDGITDVTESANVARTGVASQSSTGSFPASRAIDGNTTSNFASTTGSTTTDYWQVDLRNAYTINSINIINRDCSEGCKDRLSNVYVMVSDMPFPSDLAGSLAIADFVYQIPAPTGNVDVVVVPVFANLTGRYVRLQKSGNNVPDNVLATAEVQVMSPRDFDGDGVYNHLDIDSDNDGIPDNLEAQNSSSYTAPNPDTSSDYVTNSGMNSAYIGIGGLTPVNIDAALTPADVFPDYLDIDSDNDGVYDREESRTTTVAYALGDSDQDGLQDVFDMVVLSSSTINSNSSEGVTSFATSFLTDEANPGVEYDFRKQLDSDHDGILNMVDIDDDNDGILDDNEFLGSVQLINHALSGTATQSSTNSTFLASNAIDGNTAGTSGASNIAHTSGATSSDWWQVDLGSNQSISKVEIFSRDGCCDDRLGNVYVLIADTPFPADPNDLAGSLANADFAYQLPTVVTGDEIVEVPKTTGRYVRLQKSGNNPGGNVLNLAEVEVSGRVVNLATNGNATQSSTQSTFFASNAIDGNTAGTSGANNIAHTSGATSSDWWQVDLGSYHIISTVNIFNRDGCCGNRLSDVYVLIADTPFPDDPTDLAGSLTNADFTHQIPSSISEEEDVAVDVPNISGRYVRLQKSGMNTPDNVINIAEVEVLTNIQLFDIDGDGYDNSVDIDSDNDAIPDNVEAQNTLEYFDSDLEDDDNDGLLNNFDETRSSGASGSIGLIPINTDELDLPDFLDTDSDNDGISDNDESGEAGMLSNSDSDRDGLDDSYDDVLTTGAPFDVNDNMDDPRVDLPDADEDLFLGGGSDYRDDTTDPIQDHDGDGVRDNLDIDDDNDGILDIDECVNPRLTSQLINGSFEEPILGYSFPHNDASQVAGWQTTALDNNIETFDNSRWSSYTGVTNTVTSAQDGQWAAEINATQFSQLYQDIPTVPGDIVEWSVYHLARERGDAPFRDAMVIEFGPPSGPLVVQAVATSNNLSWQRYSGTYVIPEGQTVTRFGFRALYTNSGGRSTGNIIDNVQFNVKECLDTDGDLIIDYEDLDSDDDGIPDNVEAQTTKDYIVPSGAAGTVDFIDSNSDGLDDNFDDGIIGGGAANSKGFTPVDTDGDGIPDFLDEDSDGDMLTDSLESVSPHPSGLVGTNGLFNNAEANDDYSDVNGKAHDGSLFMLLKDNVILNPDGTNAIPLITDFNYRQGLDTDEDGIADVADIDDDNDGILDQIEGIPNFSTYTFLGIRNGSAYYVSNNTTNWTTANNAATTAGGHLAAISSAEENDFIRQALNSNGFSTARVWIGFNDVANEGTFVWTNGEPVVYTNWNTGEPNNSGGEQDFGQMQTSGKWDDGSASTIQRAVLEIAILDTDGDGLADVLDLDSDNDGIPDIIEAGGIDTDHDGRVDDSTDTDGDGWADTFDSDNGGIALADEDQDIDGLENRLDLDSDNDGIPDNVEAQATNTYIVPADDNNITYAANRGLNSNYININGINGNNGLTPEDTDLDGIPDYLDTDSDDDGFSDQLESFEITPTGSLGINGLFDNAEDGVDDYSDVNGKAFDGINFLLLDTDNDTNDDGSNADNNLGINFDFRDKLFVVPPVMRHGKYFGNGELQPKKRGNQ